MNPNSDQQSQKPDQQAPYGSGPYFSDPYQTPQTPSSYPNQYPPYSSNAVPPPPPPPPNFSSPYASDDPTIPSQMNRQRWMHTPAPPPPQRRPSRGKMLLIPLGLLLLLIGIGVALLIPYQNAQREQATATATAQAKATSVATLATGIAQANRFATATSVASNTNPYPPNQGILTLNDPLSGSNNFLPTNGGCSFTGGAYHVAVSQGGYYSTCPGGPSFVNFAIEVQMTVLKGDCGGIMFRADSAKGKYYLFETCANGDYGIFLYSGPGANDYKTLKTSKSSVIKTGLNQVNVLAVVANGQSFTLYVNRQMIDSFSDGGYSAGQTGFVVDSSGVIGGAAAPTEVAYTNEKVWIF